MNTDKKSSYSPKTIGRVLSVLECFSLEQPELTAEQIREKLGFNISTLYRYLMSMEEEGYLIKNNLTNRYTIGLHVLELAGIALSQMDIRRHGQAELDALAASTELNANMGILYQGDIFHIAFSTPFELDRTYSVLGRRSPAHTTSMGKVIYANMPAKVVQETITQFGWRPCTKHTITSFDELFHDLNQIKQNGYSLDREEQALGSWCIGAPVFKSGGEIAGAISVTGAKEHMMKNECNFSKTLLKHASRLSSKLGYIGAYFQR